MAQSSWKSILVAVSDPFRKQQIAVAKAAAIAARCGARLTLLNTFMLPQPPHDAKPMSSKAILDATVHERYQRLEKLAYPIRKQGVDVHCLAEWDFPPHEAIVRYAQKHKCDLVVADSARHNRITRWFLANTDWELIRACPCPLWFVRSPSLPQSPSFLVAVDPRHTHAKPAQLDDRLLQTAGRAARMLGGSVRIAHAYELPASAGSATIIEPMRIPVSPERARHFERDLKQQLEQLARKYDISPANRHLSMGEPATVLPDLAAKLRVHALVMGAVSRSGVERAFIGNTAEKIIDHVACDVLIVKPANFKSAVKSRKPHLVGS